MVYRDINFHSSSSYYAFSSPSSPNAPTLVVDRPSGDIRLHDGKALGAKRVSSIAGILGIINLRLDKYIVIITKTQPMGKLKGHSIHRIVATEFLPLREPQVRDTDEDTYLSILKNLLKNGPMYFSYSLDLTSSFQRQADMDLSEPLWKRADDRFFWNRYLQSDLINFRQGTNKQTSFRQSVGAHPEIDPYILPVMFGMLRVTSTSVKGNAFTYALITRRSRHRGGTRYFSRGIDEQGHVSNFNETEQIVVINDEASSGMAGYAGDGFQNGRIPGSAGKEVHILSYVQTRGSVPVYWAEVNTLKYTPKLQVRGIESAVPAAKRHFDEQIKTYGDNYLVNLVNQKGREQRVKEAYEQMVRILVSQPEEGSRADIESSEKYRVVEPAEKHQEYDRLHYIYFDFHNETKGLRWHRAQMLLDQLSKPLLEQQYFHGVDMPGDKLGRMEVRNRQTSVVRTNCMDCLDRTNVVQSMLGRYAVTRMLVDLGFLRSGENASDDASFEHLFRNVWADNADVVSRSYSGTGALKTDFTRTGNRTRAGMLQDLNNSCSRYVQNNFTDGPRQDAFDLFLGAYEPSTSDATYVDKRPLLIQAMPYILAGCLFFVFISIFTRRIPNSTVWPLRLVTLLCLAIAFWVGRFIWGHGTLYVNWPKLNTPPWATEGYQDALTSVRHDPVIGSFIRGHERGRSEARLGYMEEGFKKRKE
ncbi:MAG: hypothetical protein M1820_003664 [Bogoriella megaspora]|nr:MAG: hypothetical protein M1820_003664 [Bogoriella megaspora]